MSADFVLDTKELDRLAGAIKMNTKDILRDLAFQVEAEAKKKCPVDTGALRASIYTNTFGRSGFNGSIMKLGKKSGRKGRSNQGTRFSSIGQVEVEPIPEAEDEYTAIIGSPMEYAGYVELGTSKMGARPYLIPAFEYVVSKLNSGELWRRLFK